MSNIPTPHHLQLIRETATRDKHGDMAVTNAEVLGLLAIIDMTINTLKEAGFCTANPEGNVIHDMGKAHGIIHSTLHRLGETP